MECQICHEPTVQFLDLGRQPVCDFLTAEQARQEVMYPLVVCRCPRCTLVQLEKPVDQGALFTPTVGYHHIAALSRSFLNHMDALARSTVERFALDANDLVVEIGSNDGALLQSFNGFDLRRLGVDPTDVSDMATAQGIEVLREFFVQETGGKIVRSHGHAKAILALNTFAHVADIRSVTAGIAELLSPDGVFVSENHYLVDLLESLQYDFVYHEHLREYTVKSLATLFAAHGMQVFDVERIPTHSGSIRVFAGHLGAHPVSSRVIEMIQEENQMGLGQVAVYDLFAQDARRHQETFPKFLNDIREEGKTIAGLTFPARAVTLLNSCGIGPETLSCITELSELKIGRVSPGTHIPVVNQRVLFGDEQPDFGLVLSWHIFEELRPIFRDRGFRGKFIMPLPTPQIIE